MTDNDETMTTRHWLRAVMAQRDLDDLIGECVGDLDAVGVDSDPGSPELNRLLQERMPKHRNGDDMIALCKAVGLYEAVSDASDKWEAENARPLRVVRDA